MIFAMDATTAASAAGEPGHHPAFAPPGPPGAGLPRASTPLELLFARMLASSQESAAIQRDLDLVLATPFAREQMTAGQRAALQGMVAVLMNAELEVQEAYVRWTSSLRRVLTRAAHGRFGRLLSLASNALDAGADWVHIDPVSRGRDVDVLGVGIFDACDVSQLQLWREHEQSVITVTVAAAAGPLPAMERAALRLAAGTSSRAVAERINALVAEGGVVTAEEVFESTPTEFQRLGSPSGSADRTGRAWDAVHYRCLRIGAFSSGTAMGDRCVGVCGWRWWLLSAWPVG